MTFYELSENIKSPDDLKKLNLKELEKLCIELRRKMIETIGNTGGHLASNLGDVELTVALHYVFDSPTDKICFDVGHQAYAHKLLTGRFESFETLRQKGGISGFPDMKESEHDVFTAGHASTAISAAAGFAAARDIRGGDNDVIAVIGDGALTGGISYEGLNEIGQRRTGVIVVLNDNAMSIAPNVGALSMYLNGLRQSKGYRAFKRHIRNRLDSIPLVGKGIYQLLRKIRDSIKALFIDGQFFEALGFEYIGPLDGHDLASLIKMFRKVRKTPRPVLIHVITKKGKGFAPAESDPTGFHGIVPFYKQGRNEKTAGPVSFSEYVGAKLCEMAEKDDRVCAITAAMPDGTGLRRFSQEYPERFFDVGIAEEHAVVMAGALASEGMRPYAAIYSTFAQRAYDSLLIDIARNRLPVVLLLDRAGFVGEDGATHQGLFDISYLRTIPGMIIASPKDEDELGKMLDMSLTIDKPLTIRYPKGGEKEVGPKDDTAIEPGKWQYLMNGSDIAVFAYGQSVKFALQAAQRLENEGISCCCVNARFINPIDTQILTEACRNVKLVAVVEENICMGGLGEKISAYLCGNGSGRNILTINAGDGFIAHMTVSQQRHEHFLDADGIYERLLERYREHM